MTRKLLPALALLLALPTSVALAPSAEAAAPRCGGVKATIVGTNKSERIVGTKGRDVIVARGGNDKVVGKGGADIICGGAGNDTISSGPGAGGTLFGDRGNDTILVEADDIGVFAGDGNDVIRTTKRKTLVDAGPGDDRIEGSAYPDILDGGPGNDRINAGGGDDRYVTGGPGKDVLDGGPGTDVLRGGSGDDTIVLGPGAGGYAFGEDGKDAIAAGDDGQQLYGGPGPDLLKTAWARTRLDGQAGDDTLYGGAEPDVLIGGDGNDHLSGGAGDDVDLNGGFGTDTCVGGPGRDRCNGGAPGGPGNSPTDPDQCESEVKVSCQGDEFPERWLATVHGVETTDHETRNWTIKMVLLRAGDPATSSFWREESVTGSFSVTGSNADCTWTHSGSLDRDFTGDFGLSTAFDTYALDVVAAGVGEYVRSCKTGTVRGEERFSAWAQSGSGPDGVPWDRTKRDVVGSWEGDGPTSHIKAEWVITPLS